jgi:hypothetical protein
MQPGRRRFADWSRPAARSSAPLLWTLQAAATSDTGQPTAIEPRLERTSRAVGTNFSGLLGLYRTVHRRRTAT